MYLSIENAAAVASILNGGGVPLPSAPGFPASRLVDGHPEAPWRSSQSRTLHQIIIALPAPRVLDVVGVFDARTVGGTPIDRIRVSYTTNPEDAYYQQVAEFGPDARGDGFAETIGETALRVLVEIDVPAPGDFLQIGEVWIGPRLLLPSQPSAVGREVLRDVSSIESRGGSVWKTRRGERRTSLDLSFPPMPRAVADSIETTLDRLDDGALPVLVVADAFDDPFLRGVFHGYMGKILGGEVEPDHYWRNVRAEFVESGRLLR